MYDFALSNAYLFILLFFGLVEIGSGKFFHPNAGPDEAKIEITSFLTFLVGRPLIYVLVTAVAWYVAPQSFHAYAELPWWVWALAFLVGEDMVQYWWHRLGHTKYGWAFHRAHHSAPYMGVRVTLRNGFLYSMLMPSAYTAALFVYLGAGAVAIVYGIIKGLVTVAAHSEVRWDQYLYRNKFLAPLAWVLERTISTPATHFSHHALSEADGVGHYTGNFGNLLFFWDVLFGTALITRHYPPAFGVDDDQGQVKWSTQMFFPFSKFGDPKAASREPQTSRSSSFEAAE